jgi:hypothetical protein
LTIGQRNNVRGHSVTNLIVSGPPDKYHHELLHTVELILLHHIKSDEVPYSRHDEMIGHHDLALQGQREGTPLLKSGLESQ